MDEAVFKPAGAKGVMKAGKNGGTGHHRTEGPERGRCSKRVSEESEVKQFFKFAVKCYPEIIMVNSHNLKYSET